MSALFAILSAPMAKLAEGALLGVSIFLTTKGFFNSD